MKIKVGSVEIKALTLIADHNTVYSRQCNSVTLIFIFALLYGFIANLKFNGKTISGKSSKGNFSSPLHHECVWCAVAEVSPFIASSPTHSPTWVELAALLVPTSCGLSFLSSASAAVIAYLTSREVRLHRDWSETHNKHLCSLYLSHVPVHTVPLCQVDEVKINVQILHSE